MRSSVKARDEDTSSSDRTKYESHTRQESSSVCCFEPSCWFSPDMLFGMMRSVREHKYHL